MLHIEKIVGVGRQAVYVFHFPSQSSRHSDFPCKIGHTTSGNVRQRVGSYQAGMQEEPVIDLVIKCDDSKALEGYLHTMLADHKMPTHGAEWFMTTPDGVLAAYWDMQNLPELPLHQQVRRARHLLGMTQAQLAEAAGLRQATISALENGFDVQVTTLVEVARELGLKVALVDA